MTTIIFRDPVSERDYDTINFRGMPPVIPTAGSRVIVKDYSLRIMDSPVQYYYRRVSFDGDLHVTIIIFAQED